MPDDTKHGVDPKTSPKFFLDSRRLDLEEKKMDYEMMPGWLGRIIGSSRNAGNNIAFAVVSAVIAAGIIASFFPGDRVEFWKVIVPIITLALGYVFGQNASKS